MTMTTDDEATTRTADAQAGAGHGSLLRAEVHRFTARRFVRVLLLLVVAAYLVITPLVAVTQFAKPSAASLAAARAGVAKAVTEQNGFREECLSQPRQDDISAEEACGPPLTADDLNVSDFIEKPAFVLADNLPAGAVGVGAAVAALAFIIGATYVGAEWSSRSMVSLLFWEPRRLKVMATKLGVTAAAAVMLGVVAQAVWLVSAELMARTRGTTDALPRHFWTDLFAQQGRSTLLVVIAALIGFGIANLVRNTGASLGVGFVYFAIVENAVRVMRPGWQQWLLTDNAAALVTKGGHRIYLYESATSGGSMDGMPERQVLLSNLHGGLFLCLVTAALLAVGVWSFKRRDLQ